MCESVFEEKNKYNHLKKKVPELTFTESLRRQRETLQRHEFWIIILLRMKLGHNEAEEPVRVKLPEQKNKMFFPSVVL